MSTTRNRRPNEAASAAKPTENGDTSQKALSRHSNRGHRLFRATPSSHGTISPLLRVLRYTQGYVTVATTVGILFLHTRVQAVFYVTGALATSVMAKTIKTWVHDPRPPGSAVTKSSGMPSTHSSTVTYMAAYILLYTLRRPTELNALEVCYSLFLAMFPPLVMWSRVALGVHTVKQVAVGGLLGLITANGAWQVWNKPTMVSGMSGLALKDQPVVHYWDGVIVSLKAQLTSLIVSAWS